MLLVTEEISQIPRLRPSCRRLFARALGTFRLTAQWFTAGVARTAIGTTQAGVAATAAAAVWG
eukprot:10108512-Lingulodinium_polyedra.AAC.1